MFADIDHSHSAVRADILNWSSWITSNLELGGMRLDAIKHYSLAFLQDLIRHLDANAPEGKDLFFVGEYWDADTATLEKVIQKFQGRLNLFDVKLVYNFSDFSKGRNWDLKAVLDGSLVQRIPKHAVVSFAFQDGASYMGQLTQVAACPADFRRQS
jgi:alpha-amylase